MNALLVNILLLLTDCLGAFQQAHRSAHHLSHTGHGQCSCLWLSDSRTEASDALSPLTHANIVWKIRPAPDYPLWQNLYWRISANLLHIIQKDTILACPAGGQAVLEAYLDDKKIGRFGITTEAGPSVPPIQETVSDIYRINASIVSAAAIIYMFVEPEYRQRDLGKMALEVIAFVHAYQGCEFTVLVANDNGSGKLVEWYERHGFRQAPKLQDFFGSPNQQYGVTMIAPTNATRPTDCTIQWW